MKINLECGQLYKHNDELKKQSRHLQFKIVLGYKG